MATGRINIGGGGAGLNTFTQMSEPATKEGIWVKTSERFKKVLFETEIYSGGEWNNDTMNPIPDNPYPYVLSTSVSVENDIYILGGYSNRNGSAQRNLFQKYNVQTKTFTTLSPCPYYLANHAMTYHDGFIYAHGGIQHTGTGTGSAGSRLFKYEIAADTWTELGQIGGARMRHSIFVYDDKLYIVGGSSNNTTAQTAIYIYDTNNSTITETGKSITRFGGTGQLVGNRFYMFGGSIVSGNATATNTAIYLDLNDLSINAINNMPSARGNMASASSGSLIYLIGGNEGNIGITNNIMDNLWLYNVSDDSYITLDNLPIELSGATASISTLDSAFYIFGGTNSSAISIKTYSYRLNSKTYANQTLVVMKYNDKTGVYFTELVSPIIRPLGSNNRILSNFDDVYFYFDGDLKALESYYGDGTQWIKFKEASQ